MKTTKNTTIHTLYCIEPPVDGGFGEGTILRKDIDSNIPNVLALEYRFEDWHGDQIVTSYPCHLISREILESLTRSGASGISVKDVMVSKSEQFLDKHIYTKLPDFFWLVPLGRISTIPKYIIYDREKTQLAIWSGHDVCFGPNAELVFSKRALDAIDIESIPSSRIRTFSFFSND